MLTLPAVGISHSVLAHNVSLDVFCDWLEGSLLFGREDELSSTDIVDALVDGEVYDKQDYAREFVANAFREVERRHRSLDANSPIKIADSHMTRRVTWRNCAAYSFLLALALQKWYPRWARRFGVDYTEQGALFEELTRQALLYILPGWETYATGWTATSARKLHAVVSAVASLLYEPIGHVGRWTSESANEAGLDILCHRPLGDSRGGSPVYLVQCASGGNWENKLHTPDLRIWGRIITFTSTPRKAFSLPFALEDSELTKVVNRVDGLVLDRYRLLQPSRANPDWVSRDLQTKLRRWLKPRIADLPFE